MSPDPGMSFEEWARRQGIGPAVPGPITGEDLRTLLDVVAVLLNDGASSRVLTFEQIMAELRDLLSEGQTIADADVMPLLPGDSFEKIEGGYQWK